MRRANNLQANRRRMILGTDVRNLVKREIPVVGSSEATDTSREKILVGYV
ncbi:hypothetical protein Plhal304r1_c029g0094751 [Plasmopara halstedii]